MQVHRFEPALAFLKFNGKLRKALFFLYYYSIAEKVDSIHLGE